MIEAVLAGLFGLLIGSFLNVCIYRMPRDLSVVRPRSYCPNCETPIAWFDNVPVISYIRLRGRCRHCNASIPARYLIVELAAGLSLFSFVAALGPTLMAAKFCLLAALLIGLIFADLEERILPDEFTLGGTAAGLILAWYVPTDDPMFRMLMTPFNLQWGDRAISLVNSLAGALLPTGLLWLTGYLFEKFRQKEGLGLGDVKMIAAIGAFLGLRGTMLTLVLGAAAGSIIGLIYIRITRKDSSEYPLPFGAFLGGAALVVALGGQRVLDWYASFF
ncbi:MAG: prepilin peptidase [Bryobacteraceae bacterium]